MNRECCDCCVKKNRIIDRQQQILDKLQKDHDKWAKRHWALVGENAKLEDLLGALKHCDSKIIKKILLKD